jgi:hypothetical protein
MDRTPSFFGQIKQIFLLTQTQLIASCVLAIFIFLIEFSPILLNIFEAGSAVPQGEAEQTISQYVNGFLQYLNDLPHSRDVIVALFWGLVAILVYFLYISASNAVIIARNEIVTDTKYAKGSVIGTLIARFGSKMLAIAAFGVFIGVSLIYALPYWMHLLTVFVYSNATFVVLEYLIYGLVGLALNIYLVCAAAYFIWVYEQYG